MAATYDSSLSTDKDWVRFYMGDTVVASAKISDEEITAVLAEEDRSGSSRATRMYAAAACLEHLHVVWLSAGQGIFEKEVEDLRLRWGQDSGTASRIEDKIAGLRAQAAWALQPTPKPFSLLGNYS